MDPEKIVSAYEEALNSLRPWQRFSWEASSGCDSASLREMAERDLQDSDIDEVRETFRALITSKLSEDPTIQTIGDLILEIAEKIFRQIASEAETFVLSMDEEMYGQNDTPET